MTILENDFRIYCIYNDECKNKLFDIIKSEINKIKEDIKKRYDIDNVKINFYEVSNEKIKFSVDFIDNEIKKILNIYIQKYDLLINKKSIFFYD